MGEPSQWSIEWDDYAGGWRGRLGELQTSSYTGQEAVRRAIESGRISVAGVRSERSEQGLVSCQQSLEAEGVQTPQPLAKPRGAVPPPSRPALAGGDDAQPARQWPVSKAAQQAQIKRNEQKRRAAQRAALVVANNERIEAGAEAARAEAERDPEGAINRRKLMGSAKPFKGERKIDLEAEAKARAEAPKVSSVRQRGRRWRIILSNGEQQTETDSLKARVGRCRKRIRAWKDTVPHINRRLRRLYESQSKKKGVEFGPRLVMITLTYADANTKHKKSDGWEANHIREFMLKLRKQLKDKLWAYAWVAEMQMRESVHYHIMVCVAPNTYIPTPDKLMEDGTKLWPHGDTEVKTAERGARYLMQYVGKEYQKEGLPAGARMFAVWIGKKTATLEELLGFRLSSAPPYVQEVVKAYYAHGIVNATVLWKRKQGGGWEIICEGVVVETVQSDWYLAELREVLHEE